MKSFTIVLFDDFETLDAFGPAEIIGKLPDDYQLAYCSLYGGIIRSSQHVPVDTLSFAEVDMTGVLLIPGGKGTRELVHDEAYIRRIALAAQKAEYVLTVCTGSALLAKSGLLQGRNATTNKMAFDWVCSVDNQVKWQRKARWVVDGAFYTSSGVSAGMDMTLGFVCDRHGMACAQNIARRVEYIWNQDKDEDPFA